MDKSVLARYWRAYGGPKALLTSRYFHAAILVSLALTPYWSRNPWWEQVFSIMPSVLGFSLGGYAMWIAVGDEDFRKLISGSPKGQVSPFMSVNAAFVHFILLQVLSIFLALFAVGYQGVFDGSPLVKIFWGDYLHYLYLSYSAVAYLVFIYAIFSAIAATLQLLQVSSWYDIYISSNQTKVNENDKNDKPQN